VNIGYSIIAATLAICASGGASGQALDPLPVYRPMVDDSIVFPAVDRASRKAGVFVAPRNIAMVTPGMTKQQIYPLLDVPHFHEGLFGVRRWNYILNFYTGNGDEFRGCQYQIQFDRNARVERTYFKEQECAGLLEQRLARTPAAG